SPLGLEEGKGGLWRDPARQCQNQLAARAGGAQRDPPGTPAHYNANQRLSLNEREADEIGFEAGNGGGGAGHGGHANQPSVRQVYGPATTPARRLSAALERQRLRPSTSVISRLARSTPSRQRTLTAIIAAPSLLRPRAKD